MFHKKGASVISPFVCLLLVLGAHALGVGPALDREVDKQFFQNGSLSPLRVEAYRKRLLTKLQDSQMLLEEAEKKKGDKAAKKIAEKIAEDEQVKTLSLSLSLLDSIKRDQPDRQALARVLMLDQATQAHGQERTLPRMTAKTLNVFKSWDFSVPKSEQPRPQSRQDVLFHGGMSSLQGNQRLYSESDLVFPAEGSVLTYKKFRASQTKPKFDVTVDVKGKKKDFKIKLALETHSEVSATALAAMLGYYTDLNKHYSKIKVRFKNTQEFDQMMLEWNAFYPKYKAENYIEKTKDSKLYSSMADGSVEVVFIKALMEAKDIQGVHRLGQWNWSDAVAQDSQAARGMLMFNLWVGNPDFKGGNNKVLLKDDGQMFYLQHDLGFAFTDLLAETVNRFEGNLVDQTRGRLRFNFFSWEDRDDFKHVTYEDLKTTAKKIASLSRDQIQVAINSGGWPRAVADYLVERLLKRRNDMIQAFGLEDRYPLIAERGAYSTSDKAVVNGELKRFFFEGYPERLGTSAWGILEERIFPPIKELAVDMAAEGLSLIETLPGDNVQVNNTLFGNLRVQSVRTIEKNPKAENADELFIVKDDVTLGVELGADVVVGAKVATLWRYILVYPVATYQEARNSGGFWLSLRSPTDVDYSMIPESSVLVAEKAVEGSGMIRTDKLTGYFPVGMQVDSAYIPLKRVVVNRTQTGKISLTVDREVSGRYGADLYANLGFLRIKFAKASSQSGKVTRETFVVNEQALNQSASMQSRLNELLEDMDLDECADLCAVRDENRVYDNIYKQKKSGYNFWLYSKNNRYRLDTTTQRSTQETTNDITREKRKRWALLDDGEERRLLTRAHQGKEQLIHMNIVIDDKDTKAKEAESQIMEFIRSVFDGKLKTFSPELHSGNGLMGATQVISNIVLTREAIDALAKVDPQQFTDFAKNSYKGNLFLSGFGMWGRGYQHLKQAEKVSELLVKIKSTKSGSFERLEMAEELLNRSLLAVGGAWSGGLLGWVLRDVYKTTQGKGLYYNNFFGPAPFTENNFPVEKPLQSEHGRKPPKVERLFLDSEEWSPLMIYSQWKTAL